MILPQTYGLAVLLMILSFVLWGSWANTFKMAGKWRFELYYVDFAIGFLLLAVVLAMTVGSMGFDGFSFFDDLEHAGKRQWLFGFVAGILFNLANELLVAGISVAGMVVAFPIGIGTAMIVSSLLSFLMRPNGNLMLLLGGCLLVIGAIVIDSMAANAMVAIRHEAQARAGKAKSTRRPSAFKAILISVISGLLMGSYFPLLQKATDGEVGLGPYAITVIFAAGVMASTLVFSVFFMNLPVEGEPIELTQYFKSKFSQHLLGWLGGALWCAAMVAAFVTAAAPPQLHLPPAIAYILTQGFPVLAALWGLLAWNEFRGSDLRVKGMSVVMLVLFAAGLTLIAIAPLYAGKS